MESYYILTSKKKKTILITKNYLECYDFIIKNHDTRVRQIDYRATPKILHKEEFLRKFLKNVQENPKFFDLSEIMVKGQSNITRFLSLIGLLDKFKEYKRTMKTVL